MSARYKVVTEIGEECFFTEKAARRWIAKKGKNFNQVVLIHFSGLVEVVKSKEEGE